MLTVLFSVGADSRSSATSRTAGDESRPVSAWRDTVIARNGKPVARLVPVSAEPRRPGRLKGRLRIGADFDAPLPEGIAAAFRGERA